MAGGNHIDQIPARPDRGCGETGAIPACRIPHPSEFIAEELAARGWDKFDLAIRMGGDAARNILMIDLYFIVGPTKKNCRIGDVMAHQIGVAFDVSHQFFLNLEAAWLERGEAA